MYDVFQHKVATRKRLMIAKGARIPRAVRSDDWEPMGWTAEIPPTAVEAIDTDGYYAYEYGTKD